MRDDVQAIFDEFLPGCTLPKEVRKNPDANDYHADVPTVPNHELCELVHTLHKKDYELWEKHCATAEDGPRAEGG